MGFGTIASQVVFIFVFLTVIGSFIVLSGKNTDYIEDAVKQRQTLDDRKINSRIAINVSYDQTPNPDEITINIFNEGNTLILDNTTDIYVNNRRIKRNNENISRSFVIDTGNQRVLDPGDVQRITFPYEVATGDHRVEVKTAQGASAAAVFSI